jgi:hypothetical protein
VRPILKPGIRRLWRDGATLQLGVDPSRAVILTELTPALAAALDALDGTRSHAQVLAEADPATRALIGLIEEAGLLDDATAPGDGPPVPMLEQDRLAPDLAALSLVTSDPAGSRRLVARRRRTGIRVQGAGRVGAQVGTLLTAGGIGRVVIDDGGVTAPSDVAPGGLRLDDIGRPRAVAAGAALARVARTSRQQVSRRRRTEEPFRPDLVMVTPVGLPVVHPDESLRLEASGVPHLLAGVRETTGVVGPLVVPGSTACLHCQHLHRSALDPDWPLLALQLSRRPEHGPDACEMTLATLVAALAAMQALAFVDAGTPGPAGGQVPACADGTLEFAVPDWRIRRRSWPVHPNCPCRTARSTAVRTAGGGPLPPRPRQACAERPPSPGSGGTMESCPTSPDGPSSVLPSSPACR